ncbi:MAG: DUF2188 domain-containing protein [Planctomycetota bacterium]
MAKKKASKASKKKAAPAAKGPRVTYHVLPRKAGGWEVKEAGKSSASSTHDTKVAAVEAGRKLAKQHALGQLKVHKKDGVIQTEYTYGGDPERYKG